MEGPFAKNAFNLYSCFRIALGICGPLHPPCDDGHRYILWVVDYATKYPEAVALKTIHSITVAEALIDICSRVGVPDEILTDLGTQFVSEIVEEVSRLFSIKLLRTTAYHSQCNGLVKCFNGTLRAMLCKITQKSQRPGIDIYRLFYLQLGKLSRLPRDSRLLNLYMVGRSMNPCTF